MKKWAVLISAVGLAFSVSGCSSDYVMATKDGRMILTDGKPTVDDDTGLISYEDQQGNKMQINRDDVCNFVVYSGFFLLRSRLRLSTAIEKNMAK